MNSVLIKRNVMPPSIAAMLLCALFALQGIALGHDHDHSAHDIECPCLHADKVEWSLDVAELAPLVLSLRPLTSSQAIEAFHPASILVKRARAPPVI